MSIVRLLLAVAVPRVPWSLVTLAVLRRIHQGFRRLSLWAWGGAATGVKRHSNPITSRVASQQSHHHGPKISFRPPGFSTVDPPVSPFPGPLGGARHITLLSAGSCARLPRGQSHHGNDHRRFDCCPVYLLIESILCFSVDLWVLTLHLSL